MTIVITMAGLGSRFRKAGYNVPKYMIEAHGKTLFEWSMESLKGFDLAGIKIIDPASHLQAYQSRFSYLGAPAENVSLEDFYRSLDFIADAKEKVMKHLHKEVSRITGRDLKMVFFDCTNTYFETRLDDQEKLIRKLTHETSGMMEQEGRTQEEIEKYLET